MRLAPFRARRLAAMDRTLTRIFVVDDHPMVQEWLSTFLRTQPGLEVCGHALEPEAALRGILAATQQKTGHGR